MTGVRCFLDCFETSIHREKLLEDRRRQITMRCDPCACIGVPAPVRLCLSACVLECLCACVRSCVRAVRFGMPVSWSPALCVYASVRPCVRAYVCPCSRASVRGCTSACVCFTSEIF